MSNEKTAPVGFARPHGASWPTGPRAGALELLASLALALSTLITATVVTIGYARADALGVPTFADGGPFGAALAVGLLLVGTGVLTAFMTRGRTLRS